jgi:hypothetical protein
MMPMNRDPSTEPALVLPFRLRGYDGRVSVFYGVNRHPARWGFQHLGLPFDIALTGGFPVCRAVVDYAGEGYHAVMGWIQVVTVTDATGVRASVDDFPMHRGLETPFAEFGERPTLFDAPGPNPPRSDETWMAESFLAVVPDVARSRRVQAVLGFRWGYELTAMRATPLPVEAASETDWQRCLDALRRDYPAWVLAPHFHAE